MKEAKRMKDFRKKLQLVPELPGSYQMKDVNGHIIYVGKAKNLRRRLRSYFTGTVTGKTAMLVEDIDDFEYIVTSSELESLILEITLIKKYDPKYNILLKDDKSYPYIELTDEKYPRLRVVRNVTRKRRTSKLFGPYPNVTAARKTVSMLNRLYPLRKCEHLPKKECLYYHIHECLGYCIKEIPQETIKKMTDEIVHFLKGNSKEIEEKIKSEMEKASQNMNYERALELKTMLDDINITLTKQKIDLHKNYNFDLFAYTKQDNYLSITVFFLRNGLLFGKHHETLLTMDNEEDDLMQYIIHFYERNMKPKEILVPSIVDHELLEKYLEVKVTTPQRGALKKLLDLGEENATLELKAELEKLESDQNAKEKALKELATLLGVHSVSRMESFDNSHLFGTFYVGAMVVFQNFEPLKKEYRKFKITSEAKDDLGAMREVLYRRYYRALMENSVLPNLLVMDGGETQVAVAKEVLSSLGLSIPIIGLKKDKKHRTSIVIDQDFHILEIPKDSHLFLYLSKIQEEVHRFAITYHRNLKSKGSLSSYLDVIPGIGEIRKKELLRKFGSLKKMREASLEELKEILNQDVALRLFNALHEEEKENEE